MWNNALATSPCLAVGKTDINPEMDWLEDFEHENGNYHNTCLMCRNGFVGYKRRGYCRRCRRADDLGRFGIVLSVLYCGLMRGGNAYLMDSCLDDLKVEMWESYKYCLQSLFGKQLNALNIDLHLFEQAKTPNIHTLATVLTDLGVDVVNFYVDFPRLPRGD